MIDLILRASTKADMIRWAKARGLLVPDGEGGFTRRTGLEWSWWGGDGRFMTKPGTYAADGSVLTAPAYAPGVVLLLRIHHEFFDSDKLRPAANDPNKDEQWARSKVIRAIKQNGTKGKTGTVNHYEWDGIRIYRPQDVAAFIKAKGVPGHGFSGGSFF